MKNAFLVLVVLTCGYVGYVVWRNHAPPPPAVATAPAPIETPAPVAAPATAPVASPTPGPNLALAGTYFLLQRVSITTDSGVVGDPPGTRVTLLKTGPPMEVTDGQNVFDVAESQVTNNLDLATQAYYAARGQQAAISAVAAQEAAAFAKQQEAQQQALTDYMKAHPSTYFQPLQMQTGELNQAAQPVNVPDGDGNYRGTIH